MSLLATPATWESVLGRIREKVSKQQFATWFQNLKASSASPGEIDIRVPNQFFREWLSQNYIGVIREAVKDVTGTEPVIKFTVDETIRPRREYGLTHTVTEPPHRTSNLRINEHYTFDTFVVGPSNQLAHAAAVAVSESPGRTYNPLFVYGSVGLGKSHLLQAICHAVLRRLSERRVAYLSCETFVNEFITAIQRNDLPAFRERYRKLDILLIDDIQFLSRAERSQEEFFHTFNELYNAQKQIVLTSDQPPHELTGLQERLISRFKSGLVARIDPPSYEMCVAILHKKAEIRGVHVPSDVIEYIADVITTNIRELDGAITKILGYASLLGKPVTLDVARTALHEPKPKKSPLTIEEIIKVVTSHFKVKLSDLQSKKRNRSIVLPRQVCMYLARQHTLLSLEEIGGYFGGRDHSTVIHAEEKVRSLLASDPTFADTLAELRRALGIRETGQDG